MNAKGTTYTGAGGVTVQFIATAGTGETGTSGNVTINYAPATQYVIVNAATIEANDPYTAGISFNVTIEARDTNGNVVGNYNTPGIVLDDADGIQNPTISPNTVNFNNGLWNGLVTITQASPVILRIGLGNPDGVATDQLSSAIQIDPGALNHFTFVTQPDPNETVGSPFPISIEARDVYNNLITAYNGADLATISVSVGNIVEQSDADALIDFTTGVYSGTVVIDTEQNGSVITVSDNGVQGTGTENGTSLSFNVIGNDIYISLAEYRTPKTASVGDNVVMMEILIENRNNLDPLTLNGIEVWVESSSNAITQTVVPNTLIDSMFVEDITNGGGPYYAASIPSDDSTEVSISLPGIVVPTLSDITLRIGVRILDDISNAAVPNILLRFDEAVGDLGGSPVTCVNADTGALTTDPSGFIYSGITNISTNTETSAYNYPNPFNPQRQTTSIVYSSSSTGTTTIKIFTITGKIVRTITDNAVVGSNEAQWDGKNGRRQMVRNGVYVAVIMPPDGMKYSVKIAVVK